MEVLARPGPNTTEAEDLFQETWVSAARHAHRLEVNSQLLPWLFTIARNKHRNALRFMWFEVSRRSVVMRTGPDYVESHEGVVAEREEVGLVTECFRDLPTAFREILLLSIEDGVETPVMARILGLSESATRRRLSRAPRFPNPCHSASDEESTNEVPAAAL